MMQMSLASLAQLWQTKNSIPSGYNLVFFHGKKDGRKVRNDMKITLRYDLPDRHPDTISVRDGIRAVLECALTRFDDRGLRADVVAPDGALVGRRQMKWLRSQPGAPAGVDERKTVEAVATDIAAAPFAVMARDRDWIRDIYLRATAVHLKRNGVSLKEIKASFDLEGYSL